MTDTITIALNKLVPWKGNVRRTGATDGIEELAASIATHGLLQSLVVRKASKGKYEVIAGRRRYLALQSLAKSGELPKNQAVPCTIADSIADATELSLAENIIRAPMHPADQFEAFRVVIDGGATIADVAARFGVAEALVTKRLKLGRLSPVILDAYRQGQIGLEEAQAFTVSDDHIAQERVFADLPEWNRDADAIRSALTESEIPATDKRVRFIGLDVYDAAGGAVRRDLFDDRNGGYVQDSALLNRLVAEKLESFVGDIAGEGWSWVQVMTDLDYQTLAGFSRRYRERGEIAEDQQAELDRLAEEYDALADSDDEANSERLEAIDARIAELAPETWTAESLAISGAAIGLSHDGMLRVERGLVRKDDERKQSAKSAVERNPAALPANLTEDLTAQKGCAIAAELARRPEIALATVVHALLLGTFYLGSAEDSCLTLSGRASPMPRAITSHETCKALGVLEQERERLRNMLPDETGLWAWCLQRSRDELLDTLAIIAAVSVDTVQRKTDQSDAARLVHGAELAKALKLDMRTWFVPGAENYFARINRIGILAAIDEAKGAHSPSLDKLKKGELALRAQDLIANTGWLPAVLRDSSEAA